MTWRLLRFLTVPYLRAHPGRACVTVFGVALGVACQLGVASVNEAVIVSFQEGLRAIAGDSEIEIVAAAGTLAESDVGLASSVAGVDAAAGLLETFLPLMGDPGESLYLLGLDFLGSSMWRAQFPDDAVDVPDDLVFLSQPDSVAVTHTFAAAHGLDFDDRFEVMTPRGPLTLQVRGLVGDVRIAKLFGGALAVMDLPAAALQLGREGSVDRVLVNVAPGADRAAVRQRLAAAFGARATVTAPEARGEQAEKLLLSLRTMLSMIGFLALLLGAFVVYHTVTLAVGQRRRAFAIATAVGITPTALRRHCLVETAMLAGLGAAAGVGLGRAIAALAAPLAGAAASEIWLRVDVSAHPFAVPDALLAAGMGFTAALLAGTLAIRSVFRVATVEALRPAGAASMDERIRGWVVAGGAVAVLSGLLLVFVPRGVEGAALLAIVYAAEAMPVIGVAFLAPGVLLVAGWGMRQLTRRAANAPVRLAALHLSRAAVRGGATIGTVAAALGIACGLAILVASFQRAWLDWVEQHFAADLFVGAGGRVRLLAGPVMGPAVSRRVAAVPGVASVEPFRVMQIQFRGRPVFLQGISVRDRLAHGGLPMFAGSFEAAAPALESGEAALVSDNLAVKLDLHVGDTIDLPTPEGTHRVRIAGTFVDYLGSLDLGAVAVSHDVLRRIWHDEGANLLRVWLESGATASEVRRGVVTALGAGDGYYVLTGRAFVDGVRDVLDQFFRAGWVLIVIAACIGVVGIANTQVATMLDRAPDNSTLHTIGIPRRMLARGVLIECGLLGLLGGLLGLLVSLVLGVQATGWTVPVLSGWRIPLRVPVEQLLGAVVVATLMSAAAGWIPARLATRVRSGSGGAT